METISAADLHTAACLDIEDVERFLLRLKGRSDDDVQFKGFLPSSEEWSALDHYQRRLMIRIWIWAEKRKE